MVIERIDIESFGTLKNVHISTNSQINVFFGGNESGKSTVAAFIKFMFYGYKNKLIGKDAEDIKELKEERVPLSENEKRLYTPWTTDKVAGSIIVHFKDKKYKIIREYAERNITRILDLTTNMVIQDGEEPGEFFFKMPEEVFVKTTFLKQFGTSETGGEGLSDLIQNILFTADEDINTQKTLKRLEQAKNLLLTEKNGEVEGIIDRIIKMRDSLQDSLDVSIKDQRELFQMEGKIKEIEEKMLANNAKKNELTEELENYKAYNARQELHKIENTRRQVNNLKADYNTVVERYAYGEFIPTAEYAKELMETAENLRAKKEKLNNNMFHRGAALDKYNECVEKNNSFKIIEYEGGVEEIGETYTKMKKLENIFTVLAILSVGLSILALTGSVFAFLTQVFGNIFILSAIILIFALPAVIFFVMRNKKAGAIEEYYKSFGFEIESEFASILDDYPDTEAQLEIFKTDLDIWNKNVMDCEKEFDNAYSAARELLLKWNKTPESDNKDTNDFIKFSKQASEAHEKITEAKNIYEQYKVQLDFMLESIDENELKRLAAVARTPNYDEKRIVNYLETLDKANDQMSQMEHEVEKSIAVASKLPEPIVIYAQIRFLNSKIEELTQKYDSLCLAIEILEKSCDELKNSVSPRLSETASNLFKTATGGKYSGIFVNPDLELEFSDNLTAKKVDFLSASTKDTAYFCLRLALLDLLFDNEMPPVIFDESFSSIDSVRLENISRVVSAISRRTQVFILTCHDREANLFQRMGAHIIRNW